jgi:hypothetical protein
MQRCRRPAHGGVCRFWVFLVVCRFAAKAVEVAVASASSGAGNQTPSAPSRPYCMPSVLPEMGKSGLRIAEMG